MLAAISLDDQTMLGASEIDDESADRILPAEPIPLQTAVAQRRPEPPLGVCGGSPQVTCILVRHRYGSKTLTRLRAAPSATLSRGAGEGLQRGRFGSPRGSPPRNCSRYDGYAAVGLTLSRRRARASGVSISTRTPSLSISTSQTRDRKSTRLNSSHLGISYAVFCLKKKNNTTI